MCWLIGVSRRIFTGIYEEVKRIVRLSDEIRVKVAGVPKMPAAGDGDQ